eukprot:TRINITY_DN26235_c0_g1_i1.p1 TRINITY_DN26235_c0_g1~~TRINITY_DN26235_c0_g1_i1.p1  ORF type:complete len:434 (+),score=35.10 TRINITY_DN26235_c0_g1_i1:84-1385(+)
MGLVSCVKLWLIWKWLHTGDAIASSPDIRLPLLRREAAPLTSGEASTLETFCRSRPWYDRLERNLQRDFRRYHPGSYDVGSYRSYCEMQGAHCMTLQIVEGQVFVKNFKQDHNDQSRLRAALLQFNKVAIQMRQLLGTLPDAEMVLTVADQQISRDLPVFALTYPISKPVGILYPDFTFYSFPESSCGGDRSHAYPYLMKLFRGADDTNTRSIPAANATHFADWTSKKDDLFWRGSPTGDRHHLIKKWLLPLQEHVDVHMMHWEPVSVRPDKNASGCVGLMEHCRHRYLAFFEGSTYSSRFKYMLLCGSCVIAPEPQWAEWWTGLFEPGADFVQAKKDWSDISDVYGRLRSSADGGQAIAHRGRQKALEVFDPDVISCYWMKLIEAASIHLPRPEASSVSDLPETTRPIEDVLVMLDSSTILLQREQASDGKS